MLTDRAQSILLFLVVLAAACPVCCWGPARADEPARVDALQALRVLCPGRLAMAPAFDRAAERHRVPAGLLVAMARNESTCNPGAIGKGGEVGLMQLRPGTIAAGKVQLSRLDLPAVNVDLGARHLARCLRLCGDVPAALGVYSGRRTCAQGRASGYARRVMGFYELAINERKQS